MYGYHNINQEYFTMQEVIKAINIKGYGKIKIFELLRKKKILNLNNQPFEEFVRSGYFKPVINMVASYKNRCFYSSSCRVSSSGIEFIKTLILQETV